MIAWAVEALVASSLLMLAVLLVRAPVRRVAGPQVAYWLWALPALRLALPPLPAAWREQAVLPISRAGEAVTVLILPAADAGPAMAEAAAPLPWGAIVAGLWVAGAGIFFVHHLIRHRRFCRGLLREAQMVDRIGGVRVVATPAAAGPLAFGLEAGGLGARYVAFPLDFADRYDADERALALAHELGHHARGDLFANWLALAVLALHWFNPLAWRAFRAFRADQELANDARVLAGRSRTDRHIYACAIVKAAHGGAIRATCHLHTISDLKGRLRMLTVARPSRTRLAGGMAAVAGLVAGGLVVTASGTATAAAVTDRLEAATGIAIQTPATPATPTPPAVPETPPAIAATVPAVVAASDPKIATTLSQAPRVVVVRHGRTEVAGDDHPIAAALAAVPALPAAPARPLSPLAPPTPMAPLHVTVPDIAVREAKCGANGTQHSYTIAEANGRRRTTVICTDRIERSARIAADRAHAADTAARIAVADAGRAQRQALRAALGSLYASRTSLNADTMIGDEARRHALAGIDHAIRGIQSEIAEDDHH